MFSPYGLYDMCWWVVWVKRYMALGGEGFLLVLLFGVMWGSGDVRHCVVMRFGEEWELR